MFQTYTLSGVGMYSPPFGIVSNNSLIVATNGGLDTIYCISGSTEPEVGRWIAPNGEDFTQPGGHPFNVVQGDTSNPGVLEISLSPQGRFSTSEWLGGYSCVIPDEENSTRIIHVGIHTSARKLKFIECKDYMSMTLNWCTMRVTVRCIYYSINKPSVSHGYRYYNVHIVT